MKAASCKVAKHEKTCFNNYHTFIPFVFDTFSFLASEAVSLLQRIQKVMNNNVLSAMNVVLRIEFANKNEKRRNYSYVIILYLLMKVHTPMIKK
jgi:hypothetical protein